MVRKHLIFLQKAIGGGNLMATEGRLAGQVATLSREFDWWINGLERGGERSVPLKPLLVELRESVVMSIASCIPKSLFASDAFKVINLDSAEWVKENLSSQIQEYRSNFARPTTNCLGWLVLEWWCQLF